MPNWDLDANDMKFGKNIGRVVELSDPEWSPFWINYKFLKKKVKVCVLRCVVASAFFARHRAAVTERIFTWVVIHEIEHK